MAEITPIGHRSRAAPEDRTFGPSNDRGPASDPDIHAILSTGGTGVTGRDSTPEAVEPLLDKRVEGFGELFRQISREEIGTSAIQSRAFAGLANGTFVFCLPGSTGACRTAWERILLAQLDSRTHPCNFAQLIPRLLEDR